MSKANNKQLKIYLKAMKNLNLILGIIILLVVLIAIFSNLNNKPVFWNGFLILASGLITAFLVRLIRRYFLSKRK